MAFRAGVYTVLLVFIFWQLRVSNSNASTHHYTNSWAVHIPNIHPEKVSEIARRHGMINLGQVGTLEGYYHFKHRAYPTRMRRATIEHTAKLSREFKVKWVEQQIVKRRVKRDGLYPDPLWVKQWYLHNDDKLFKNYDHNVISVWKTLNITGRGVSVSILDDGIEKNHPDLKDNYDPDASYDYNNNDPDPSPRNTFNDENRHGTRCAGEVAAIAGNKHCGIGVAYGAKVGGIRMLDGEVTDVVEAHSLSFRPEHIDIYSSSWGPDDDGKTVDGPGPLAKVAFSEGITKGRGGLGNIFVWASGNGGRDQDNCNCDGYTNSIYTLSISSATEHGTSPWYSEFCASTLASTFSSGSWGMRKIVTTDLHGRCTQEHTGTSASAPLAAGILALALEANPKLTWRDMQHIVVRTSKPEKLKSNDWVTNGVGRKISHRFGYGLLDARDLVDLALRWDTVPEKHDCSEAADTTPRSIPQQGSLTVEKDTTGCEGSENYIRYLEHVEVVLSLSFTRRGDLTIYLTSPRGTRSTLLGKRRMDYSSKGFKDWAFLSTHTWEENPRGKWKLEIENVGRGGNSGTLKSWQLRFHGTKEKPGVSFTNCSSECKGGCHGPTARDCVQCANYKSNGVCLSKCQDNEYADVVTKECKSCDSVCQKCDGPGSNQCTSCKAPKLLLNTSCVTSCPSGWFATEDNRCDKCDPNCLTCSNKAVFCSACREDHKLEMNRCVMDCKDNSYVFNDRCWPCHPSCKTCNNGSAWSCTQCGVTTATRERVKTDLYLHRGMCVITCPSGFYGDDHQCAPCHTSCKHCKGPLDKDCTACKDGLVRVDNGTGLCLDNCPSGSSHRISEDTCVTCGTKCSSCDPQLPSNCTACNEGLFLWQRKCMTADACPRSTYPDSQKCKYCHPSCDSCSSQPTFCTACSGYSYLHDNACKYECPVGTYGKENKCLQCNANCSSCFGGSQAQCLNCTNGLYLFNNTCVKQCPFQTFADKAGQCQSCSLTCEGCVGEATNCTKCKDGLSKHGGVCKSLCADGMYFNTSLAIQIRANKTTDQCSECHTSCSQCFGPTKYDCLRCKGVKFRDPKSKLCSLNCPQLGYYERFTSTLCEACPSTCISCINLTKCSKCVPGLFLYESRCIRSCPKGFFAEKSTDTCKPCDDGCKKCVGSSTSCTQCDPSRILYKNQCITKCPSGTFLSKEFNRCMPCDISCLTCVGSGRSHCTTCKPNLVLFQAQCRTGCPARYYYNSNKKSCQPCDQYCHRCSSGHGVLSCTDCLPPFVLENKVCVRTCSPGYALDRVSRTCVRCHESCETCMGPNPDQCTSCKNSKDILQDSLCRKSCSDGMYRNAERSQCESCHPTCKTCTGSGKAACTSCVEALSLSKTSECLSSCPGGQYKHNNVCYTCSSGCKTCKGATSQHCLNCHDGRRLFNFTCVKSCPPGTYEQNSNGIPECQQCHPFCATCTSAGSDACTSCGMDLYLQETSCVQECSVKHILDENTKKCNLCDSDCPTYTNFTHRSAHVPNQSDQSEKHENYFILIATATCLSLLSVFALLGLCRSRSSHGYTKVDNNSTPSVEAPPSCNNNVPSVYIRDDNAERQAMLHTDDEM